MMSTMLDPEISNPGKALAVAFLLFQPANRQLPTGDPAKRRHVSRTAGTSWKRLLVRTQDPVNFDEEVKLLVSVRQ